MRTGPEGSARECIAETHAFRDEMGAEDADLWQQRSEFVTADSRHHVPSPNQQPEGVTDDAQQRVSGPVAFRVVHFLEAVDVK